MWGGGLSAHREITGAVSSGQHSKENPMIPVSSQLLGVLREERLREAQRRARAQRTRRRPDADAGANRPVNVWSSLLIAVRLRPAA